MDRERVEFPGRPERYSRQTLAITVSRDGLPVEFYKLWDHENPHQRKSWIEVATSGVGGVQISLDKLESLGDGDVEQGLKHVVEATAQLDFGNVVAGDMHPLYSEFINPVLGTEDFSQI